MAAAGQTGQPGPRQLGRSTAGSLPDFLAQPSVIRQVQGRLTQSRPASPPPGTVYIHQLLPTAKSSANRSCPSPMELTLDSPSLTLNLISWTPSGRRPPQAGPCTVLKGILPTKRHPPHPLETQPQTAPDASTPDICECPPHAHMCQALSTARRARPGSYRELCSLGQEGLGSQAQAHGQCKLRQPQTWAPPAWGPGGRTPQGLASSCLVG